MMARSMNTVGLVVALLAALFVSACDENDRIGACEPALRDLRSEPRWVAIPGQHDLAVFVEGASTPVAGQMVAGPQGPAFHPAFPFASGVRYRVQGESCEATFELRPKYASAPQVTEIYPRDQTIPENILRFYVYFSEPMGEGGFLDHVRLEHVESGQDITGAFFDNIYELWSPDRKRITVLVDPGRVKTGLRANRAMGRAFEAGQTYRLHILDTWTSIHGRPLSAGFTKTYRAETEDRRRVDPDRWCLALPESGTHDPLEVQFGEAVDHVSVGRFLTVVSARGVVLPGAWGLGSTDTSARWTPEDAWSDAVTEHRLSINGRFEDIAGNNINAAMDHRVGALSPGDEGRTISRAFSDDCPAS